MKIRKTKLFIIGFIIFAATTFFLLNFLAFQKYQSQLSIIFYSKNNFTSENISLIAQDAKIIGESLKIYDQIYETDSKISLNAFRENQKKWNETIKISIPENSSILKMTFSSPSQEENLMLSENFLKYFMPNLSQYFNIKNIGFSILEKTPVFKKSSFAFNKSFWLSLVLGLIGGWIAVKISHLWQNAKRKLENTKKSFDFKMPSLDKTIPKKESKELDIKEESRQEKINQKIETDSFSPQTLKEEYASEKEVEDFSKKSDAPLNLPLAGDEIERMFGATKNGSGYRAPEEKSERENVEEATKETLEEKYIKEATPEEVKERLNKLLGSI